MSIIWYNLKDELFLNKFSYYLDIIIAMAKRTPEEKTPFILALVTHNSKTNSVDTFRNIGR